MDTLHLDKYEVEFLRKGYLNSFESWIFLIEDREARFNELASPNDDGSADVTVDITKALMRYIGSKSNPLYKKMQDFYINGISDREYCLLKIREVVKEDNEIYIKLIEDLEDKIEKLEGEIEKLKAKKGWFR